jgi:putative Mg2+ transporter-C (MgtC) family protein
MFPIPEEYITTFARITTALLLGGLIGLERSYNGRPAGFRTHSLVCMASSLLMLLTVYQWKLLEGAPIDTIRVDPTRMAQGIMTGVGFLGAGVIMKERFTIRGLTTAASIWITASIGIIVGMGFYFAAFLSTVLALGTLSVFRWFEHILPTLQFGRLTVRSLRKAHFDEEDLAEIIKYHNVRCSGFSYHLEGEGKMQKLETTISTRNQKNFRKLAETLSQIEDISEYSVTPRSS